MIGPNWLSCADQYSRRRIDDPEDWVRKELLAVKDLKEKRGSLGRPPLILVYTVGGIHKPPDKGGLPKVLRWLPFIQAETIDDKKWYADVGTLMKKLEEYLPVPAGIPLPYPSKDKDQKLNPDELANALRTLDGWEPVQSLYPPRHELRKIYVFRTFDQAVGFMQFAASRVNEANHHPRWENLWRSVTVYFTTLDAGCQITRHDIRAACDMNDWYDEYSKTRQT